MAKEKLKASFTLNGVKYKDIPYSVYSFSKAYMVGVAGTATMIRQFVAQKFPLFAKYMWVKSRSFAGGDAIDVSFHLLPMEEFSKIKRELQANFSEGYFDGMQDMYVYTKKDEKPIDLDANVDFGTKYLHVDNTPPYYAKEKDEPAPDWENILKQPVSTAIPKTTTTGSYPKTSSWSYGDFIKSCGGWNIYKKTLPSGSVVFNAVIDKATEKNKNDWSLIRGEIQTETNFKWTPKGQSFSRWGSVEDSVIDKLCSLLEKWYGKKEPAAQQSYTQEQLLNAIAALDALGDKGNKVAQKQANVLRYLLK